MGISLLISKSLYLHGRENLFFTNYGQSRLPQNCIISMVARKAANLIWIATLSKEEDLERAIDLIQFKV